METVDARSPQASSSGTLYGIGVGPGDPELISLKGWKRLQQVPVVAFPEGLGGKPGIAERIVTPWLREDCIRLPLHFPYVQEADVLQSAWYAAADTTSRYLLDGKDVAFVSEGDVSFYSTFTYLAYSIRDRHPHIPIEVIPGICSPLAAAGVLGLPLTVQHQRLMVLPALYTVSHLETVLKQTDVLVLMKVSSVYEQVWQVLQQHGLLQRSYVVEWATHPQQAIYADLSDRPHLKLSYFSLLIVQVHPNSIGQGQFLAGCWTS